MSLHAHIFHMGGVYAPPLFFMLSKYDYSSINIIKHGGESG